jgi:hypothetical protein
MTLPTFDSARDEILGLFNVYWTANTPALNGGTAVPIRWEGQDAGDPPPAGSPWARIVVRHTDSRQSTLAPVGQGRATRYGLVTVQVFAPLSNGDGLSLAENLAIIARAAYERRSTASGIWFRNPTIREVGPDGSWYQTNLVVQFEYDELN